MPEFTIADVGKLTATQFDVLLPAIIDPEKLANELAIHTMTGHFYDVEKQMIYRAATVLVARMRPDLITGEPEEEESAGGAV